MKAEKDFWDWFVRHEPKLFNFRGDQEDAREHIFDELAAQLRKVHPDLAFEFGPNEARGGIKGAFPSVASILS